jgi:hypothetical protein|uniref:Uncharacterized protein n=1 Tax=Picea glauca TaxID=3330 RepID=A0A124GNJ7_PICGL|nr:hypothetical protein ABT39_MTgene4363 [Picea glauca]
MDQSKSLSEVVGIKIKVVGIRLGLMRELCIGYLGSMSKSRIR